MIKGIFAPIPTPFRNDQIDYGRLEENLSRWAETRLSGLVVLGSNGEFVYLTQKEKVKLVAAVREMFPSDRPVIAGTGCETTRETVELTKKCAEVGADAALILTPHYFGGSMTAAVLKRFFISVAEASPIPIMLYNMPKNTGINMASSLVVELSEHPNIAGIKDSSGNIVQISEICKDTPDDFAVFAGSGSFLLPSLVMGASGGTLAVANIMANTCVEIFESYANGQLARARELQRRVLGPNAAVTSRFSIPGLKAALDMIGYYGGPPRPPLEPLPEEDQGALREILTTAGLLPG